MVKGNYQYLHHILPLHSLTTNLTKIEFKMLIINKINNTKDGQTCL